MKYYSFSSIAETIETMAMTGNEKLLLLRRILRISPADVQPVVYAETKRLGPNSLFPTEEYECQRCKERTLVVCGRHPPKFCSYCGGKHI